MRYNGGWHGVSMGSGGDEVLLSRMCDPSLSGKRALGEHADSDDGHPWEKPLTPGQR